MYFRKKISGGRVYLQIAESRRVGGQVRQRVVVTLGRLDALQASGQLERLVRSGARFAARALVVTAAQDDPTAAVRRIGPALVFERLWAETGCRAVIDVNRLRILTPDWSGPLGPDSGQAAGLTGDRACCSSKVIGLR
jgi:hypothetical protein